MSKQFTSIAEAVAYYAVEGYSTVQYTDRSRLMKRKGDQVLISRIDLLQVIATEHLYQNYETSDHKEVF